MFTEYEKLAVMELN